MTIRTFILTALALTAFAGNSVLCRMALGAGLIDAASFATVRVVTGAVVLALIMVPRRRSRPRGSPDWRTALGLFLYMVFFSFAYLELTTGTGALILFGAVQITMFVAALRSGERFGALSWGGLVLAFGGLVYLVSPGLVAPDPLSAGLMVVAGMGWGWYSLRGRQVADPLAATASNFLLCVPLVVVVSVVFFGDVALTKQGLLLAVVSGGLTSGVGYAVWYEALRGLSATRAATVQLSVPAIAAVGGVLFLSEAVSLRLVLATAATLGGVGIVLAQRARSARP